MAVPPVVDDPQAQLRKRLIARGGLSPAPEPGAPVAVPPPPAVGPDRATSPPQVNTAVQPDRQIAPAASGPPAPAAPAPSMPGTSWLDWITSAYGQSKDAPTGFADLPQGTSLEQAIGRFNQETGAQAKYLGGPSGDRVDFGRGAEDALTSSGKLWQANDPRSGPSGAGGNASGGGYGGGTSSGAGGDYQSQIRALLMQRLGAAGQAVDPTDRNIADPLAAAQLEAGRATQMERTALAERRAASGDTSGSLDQAIQQSGERNAVGLGGLRAQLISKEYDARRQQMTELLQLATASGDAESARTIQMKIAELDATVRREGIGVDAAKYEAYLNQDAAKAGLNG